MEKSFIKNKCNLLALDEMQEKRTMTKAKSAYECLLSMRDLGKYVDKWIAIVDNEIVSVGTTGKDVFKQARQKHPDKAPFILKVPSNSVMLL